MLSERPSRRASLGSDRRSSVALEFVLVAPLLIIMMFGVYDLSCALIVYQQVYAAAHSIAASVTNLSVQASGSTVLSYDQVQEAASEIWGNIPWLRSGQQDGLKSITISSISFERISTAANCDTGTNTCYTPVVVWSEVYTGGDSVRAFQLSSSINSSVTYTPVGSFQLGYNANGNTAQTVSTIQSTVPLRSCSAQNTANVPGSLNQTGPTGGQSSDLSNLRTLLLGQIENGSLPVPPSPIIVVDVHLKFNPVIGLFFPGGMDFWVNGYWPVRSVKTTVGTTAQLYQQFTTMSAESINNSNSPNYTDGIARNIDDYCVNTTLANPPAESTP